MTTVTSLTADRMLAIEAASVIDGDVDGSGNLILTKHDGSHINAGSVIGPTGPQGPVGSDLVVLSAISVLDVGLVGQIRAGRQLTAADFTNMGLNAPLGLWNLSDLSDVSGNGRNLLNKGAVPFDIGINGLAASAAKFLGSGGQSLYIPDTGAADSFRIKTGTVGCWFRTAKRGSFQMLVDKYVTAPQQIFSLHVTDTNVARFGVCPDGSNNAYSATGVTDIADDRWHFAVGTFDGTNIRIYVDSVLEGTSYLASFMFSGSSVFNIGCRGSDAANAGAYQHLGRIDEAFITSDILSEEQIRNLYCTKIPHTLAVVPSRASLNVRRRKRGATLVAADFSTQPLRLHNFSGGSLGDEGSNGVPQILVGTPVSVSGVDGSSGNAYNFNGNQALGSTDAGLPAALATRSYGCWFKTMSLAAMNIMLWGTLATGDARLLSDSSGKINAFSGADAILGPFVADALWHHCVVVEDSAAVDGVKRKMYLDGRLVGESVVLNAITLAGASSFRIGSNSSGTGTFTGQVDTAFICGYALTFEQIAMLYAKGSKALTPSPKNEGDHVEAMDTNNILATFDTLESQHQIDLRVAA